YRRTGDEQGRQQQHQTEHAGTANPDAANRRAPVAPRRGHAGRAHRPIALLTPARILLSPPGASTDRGHVHANAQPIARIVVELGGVGFTAVAVGHQVTGDPLLGMPFVDHRADLPGRVVDVVAVAGAPTGDVRTDAAPE